MTNKETKVDVGRKEKEGDEGGVGRARTKRKGGRKGIKNDRRGMERLAIPLFERYQCDATIVFSRANALYSQFTFVIPSLKRIIE